MAKGPLCAWRSVRGEWARCLRGKTCVAIRCVRCDPERGCRLARGNSWRARRSRWGATAQFLLAPLPRAGRTLRRVSTQRLTLTPPLPAAQPANNGAAGERAAAGARCGGPRRRALVICM